jgi:hypothetical protein
MSRAQRQYYPKPNAEPRLVRRSFLNRRSFLAGATGGLGSIALIDLLARDGLMGRAAASTQNPTIDPAAPNHARPTHARACAKNVLVIFCAGAISQIDTFDFKPELIKRHDQPMPGSDKLITFQGAQGNLAKSPWTFRPRGQCGKLTSDLLPMLGELVDDMCFIHSLTSITSSHGPAETFMSTGFTLEGFPSMGSWVSYALGTENQDLPAYVAISDPRGAPQSGAVNWGNGFLPAAFQGTPLAAGKSVPNLNPPVGIDQAADRDTRGFLRELNNAQLEQYPGDTELAARIASYELAARMQISVPEALDLSRESVTTLEAYGVNDANKQKAAFASNCVLARRLLERGVRFVELFSGAYQNGGEGVANWDSHRRLKEQYDVHGPVLDQPVAALLADLKSRGMLEDTLVVFTTEFGRMPTFQRAVVGRDHNPKGFTAWLAGAGVKAPYSFGATDEFGYQAVENVVDVHDFHATILHLLGLDHEALTFYHNGTQRRLTDVHGFVMEEILA